MKRAFHIVVMAVLASEAFVIGQGGDAAHLLATVRAALGGDQKLTAITSLALAGQTTRVSSDATSNSTEFEIAMQLPDKYVKKEIVAVLGGASLSRTSGFNGAGLIDAMDAPPGMGSPGMVIRMAGPSGALMGMPQTPEQEAEARRAAMLASQQEFARLALGLFGASFKGYPLAFAAIEHVESPDGPADVIDVTGDGAFAGKLFVDSRTHLPRMLTWMAKEPLRMTPGPGGAASGGERVVAGGGSALSSFQAGTMTADDREALLKDLSDRMQAADAARRVVEYRLSYLDYRDVQGLKMPSRIQRSIDGTAVDEMSFSTMRLNPRIDPRTFETVK